MGNAALILFRKIEGSVGSNAAAIQRTPTVGDGWMQGPGRHSLPKVTQKLMHGPMWDGWQPASEPRSFVSDTGGTLRHNSAVPFSSAALQAICRPSEWSI